MNEVHDGLRCAYCIHAFGTNVIANGAQAAADVRALSREQKQVEDLAMCYVSLFHIPIHVLRENPKKKILI